MDPSADPLISLRRSIASDNPPTATSSADATDASSATENLALATHLHFDAPDHQIFSLDTPTRFISSDKPVDLRSIYFAWLKKDVAIPDYIASTQELNEQLAGKSRVQNLVFVERLDLITWLEGASDESEYIKVSEADAAAKSAQVASGAAGGVSTVPSSGAGVRPGKPVDPRLQEIYNGERRIGDRNSVLRGIKPTVSPLAREQSLFSKPTNSQSHVGLLPRPQIRRDLPLARSCAPTPPRRSLHRIPPLDASLLPRLAPQEALPPTRPHHPALPLRLLPAAHVEHQILPRIRDLHPAGRRARRLLGHQRQHPAHLAAAAQHRRAPPAALHHRRHARAVQARLLGPRRRGADHGPDVAVQELQVAERAGFVQACAGDLCGVEGRGCSWDGEGVGQGRGECAGGEVECRVGRAGQVEG